MNRELFRLQCHQRECNKWFLAWSRERQIRRNRAIREAVLSVIVIAAVFAFWII